jgi:hypothetical protein
MMSLAHPFVRDIFHFISSFITTIITYDDHGYAEGVSITAGSIQNLKIQLLKLHLFSQYTGLPLETSKCKTNGALWALDNPLTHKQKPNNITRTNPHHHLPRLLTYPIPPPQTNPTKCLGFTLTPSSTSDNTSPTSLKMFEN